MKARIIKKDLIKQFGYEWYEVIEIFDKIYYTLLIEGNKTDFKINEIEVIK